MTGPPVTTAAPASAGTARRCELNRFFARLGPGGSFEYASGLDCVAPQLREGVIVFLRGFLSNRADLLRALALDPADVRDDADLLAHAWRRWAADLQRHVLGEYAAAFYDPSRRTLLLTHDALGLGQIFYTVQDGGIAFGTHLIDLAEAAASRELDREYLATYLARGYLTTERTPFPGLRRLLPGMSLTWSPATTRVFCTWDPTRIPPLRLKSPAEYEEQFRGLINDALHATVNHSGNTWVSLSGGLDSSTVLSVAASLNLPNLGAYSVISPTSPQGDEQHWARAVIDQYQLPWHTLDAADALPFAELPTSFPFQGEPTSAVLQLKAIRHIDALFAEHNVSTLLTGHGGDALLGASAGTVPAVLVDHLFAGHPLRSLRAVRDWSANHANRRSVAFLLWHAVLKPAAAHLAGYTFEAGIPLAVPPWIDPDYARAHRILHASRRQPATHDRYPGRQVIWDSVWSLAVSSGSARTHGGYDVRRPLLHRPFFEFMYAIPGEERNQPRCDRYLQRRALKGILPEAVRRRSAKLFGTWAFVEGMARNPAYLDYLCDDPQLARYGVTTAATWREAMQQASIGNTAGDRFFIAGITLEVWLKQFADWRPQTRALQSVPPSVQSPV